MERFSLVKLLLNRNVMSKNNLFESCTPNDEFEEALKNTCDTKKVTIESICLGDEGVGKSVFLEVNLFFKF